MRRAQLAILLVAAIGCGRKPAASAHRTIVLTPAENLTGDPSLDWIGPAIPVLIASQLESLPGISLHSVERYPDAAAIKDHETLHCRYQRSGADRLGLHCWLEGKETDVEAIGPPSSISSWISPAGRYIDSAAAAPSPISDKALQAFAAHRYEEAIVEAPDFAAAYVQGVTFAVRQGDQARARNLLDAAQKRGTGIPPAVRARLDLTRATMAGDRLAQLTALMTLDKLQPPDESRLKAMVQLLQSMKRNPEAAAAQARLTELHPESADDWNQLAYARAWAGDFDGAAKALERYRALDPNSPNVPDSMGEVNYYFGRFAEAEKLFLESYAKGPQFNSGQALYKAAVAKLNSGDAAGAAKLFEQFSAARGPEKPLLDAGWLYMNGKSREAETALAAVAAQAKGDVAARAHTQLAFWDCVRKDWQAARANLSKAVALQPSNQTRVSIAMVAFIAGPDTNATELKARAGKMFASPAMASLRDSVLAIALLLRDQAADALPIASELEKSQPPAADRVGRILLARCLAETGKRGIAVEQLKVHPIPVVPTATPFESWLMAVERELR